MNLKFHKYQATGNDFILVDNRGNTFPRENSKAISRLCDRKFGIGADGLILIENTTDSNFLMHYYNADGGIGSLCGNGSRAAISFAKSIGLIATSGKFEAYDGIHKAIIAESLFKLNLADVQNGSKILNGTFIDTGSPHYVEECTDLDDIDVHTKGKLLRHSDVFKPEGSNINFVERLSSNKIKVRTFERGVEAETLSCGTGVTASALVTANIEGLNDINIATLGGELRVQFEKTKVGFQDIWLEGPAKKVFSGEITI